MEQSQIEKLNSEFFTGVTTASIFLAFGIIIRGFGRYGIYYSAIFLTIAIVIMIVTIMNYLQGRGELKEKGEEVPSQLNHFIIIIIIVIIISLIAIYDILTFDPDKTK